MALKKSFLKISMASLLCGILSGTAASIFLIALKYVTEFRDDNIFIIGALPLVGLIIGWIYYKFGPSISNGHNLILDEIHDPKNTIPFRMAPFIFISTVLTHLFGGSAGREGTVVQMGASLADQLSYFFKLDKNERRRLLIAGTSAGFGAALGAPWAGVVFGMEVIHHGRIEKIAWYECVMASLIAYYTSIFLQAPHTLFQIIHVPNISLSSIGSVILAGVIFGLFARLFISLAHLYERKFISIIKYPPLKPFVGGSVLVLLYYVEGTYKYVGLGIPQIENAFDQIASINDPILKTVFTILTVGSGFKGGEFVPLVFIGSNLGSYLSIYLPLSVQLLAALGFASVFAGAAKTPLACAVMAMELFGYKIGLFAFLTCYTSYLFAGYSSLYTSQKINKKIITAKKILSFF